MGGNCNRPRRRGRPGSRTNPECLAVRHGSDSAYTDAGCRCAEAREAWRLYNKRRREGRHTPRLVSGVGPARRIQALMAFGWTWRALAREAGRSVRTVQDVGTCRRPTVHTDTHGWVHAMYERLSATPGGSKYAQTVANRYGWVPPLAWDDDTIDDPDAAPWTGDDTAGEVVDEVAIARALRGERLNLTSAERHHAVHAGKARMPLYEVAEALHLSYTQAKYLSSKPLPGAEAAA